METNAPMSTLARTLPGVVEATRVASEPGEPASWADVRSQFAAYYQSPAVQARILEFLGVDGGNAPAAHFVTTKPTVLQDPSSPTPLSGLWTAVGNELELARSLWDRHGLLAHIEIEHVHFDRPWETYSCPARAFALQEPVAEALEARLAEAGIAPLHILTGRGHHWAWLIPRESEAFSALAALAPSAPRGCADCASLEPPVSEALDEGTAAAYRGLGLVLEWIGHEVLRAVEGTRAVPVQLTAITVGPGSSGREIVSIDLSPFGDPLPTRTVRVPFTAYLKGWRIGRQLSPPLVFPPLVAIAVPASMPLAEALAARHPDRAARLAGRTSAILPNGQAGTLRLIAGYRASPLADFHRWYYACEPEPPERWPETYDRLDLAALPPCARQVLEQPNDRILRPADLQHLVRVLLSLGWHPRHIAGLVRSKLERDHGWQPGLHFFDADLRSDFYVRLFAGLALAGTDPLIDFNCVSAGEKLLCPSAGCGWNVEELRDALRGKVLRWVTGR